MKPLLLFSALLFMGGCATIVSGTQQTLFIDTPHMEGATCKLNDSKGGNWYLDNSPGATTVHKGNGPMNIKCSKKGYKTKVVSVEEEFSGATLGNVILGGGIGIFVDAASGAAQKYPDKIIVWMEPKNWNSTAAKEKWNAEKNAYEAEVERLAEEKRKRSQSQNRSMNN